MVGAVSYSRIQRSEAILTVEHLLWEAILVDDGSDRGGSVNRRAESVRMDIQEYILS